MAKNNNGPVQIKYMLHRSFNTNDCKVVSVDGRIDVVVDVPRRHKLVVNAFGRMGSAGCDNAEEMAEYLNERLHIEAYRARDITHSFRVLAKHGIIEKVGSSWRLTRRGQAIWNKAEFVRMS